MAAVTICSDFGNPPPQKSDTVSIVSPSISHEVMGTDAGTWNVRSMNQGKLEVIKQEMARVNVDILGISELKWTGMGEFNSMTIISTTEGRNPSEEME